MNVLIVSYKGILDTPIIVEDDVTASAVFRDLAEKLAGSDDIADEVRFGTDNELADLNHLLAGLGIEVSWFVNVGVNDYVNEEE